MPSDLTKTFDASRQMPSGEALEELRQHYFTHATMRELDDTNIGGVRINAGGRKSAADIERQKRQAASDLLLIQQLTDGMAAKYGAGFAAQFAAPLLDKDTFERINQIEDIDKRREAFAKAINDGIRDGTITLEDAYANPDFADWLRKHDEVENAQLNSKIEVTADQTMQVDNVVDDENELANNLDNFFSP